MAERILVSGRVQGVGFRAFTRDAARERGVAGWVRNLDDGRVEAHLEGAEADVERLIAALAEGPSFGRVDDLEQRGVPDEGMHGFDIRS